MNRTDYANNIFEQPWWLDIVAPGCWKEIIVKDDNDNVIARQALVFKGNRLYMPKLTQTLGIWLSEKAQIDYGSRKKAIQGIISQTKDFSSAAICLSPENDYILPYRWAGYELEPRFTYRLSDLSDTEALYSGFNKTARKNIKYASNKVNISYDLNKDELWDTLNKTFQGQSRKNPMDKELVFRIVEECEKNGNGKYICAKDPEGNVHSCAYFVYDDKVCYYLLGATDPEFRSSGAQSLILWEGIKFASGVSRVFDFEGSMIEGIENFFRQFGGNCCVYYEVRKQSLINEVLRIIKPKIKRMIGYKI